MKNAEQNGQTDAGVLHWTGKLLSADDLRRHWKGQRELIVLRQTIVTPLAVDELKDRGVRLVRDAAGGLASEPTSAKPPGAGYALERPNPIVTSAVQSLEREGVKLEALPTCDGASWDWARQLAECIARGDCLGAVVFCADPGVVCCVANKIGAVRAISVLTSTQAARARTSIGANMLAVEMPGRTFFEVRQILKALSRTAAECPQKIADVLQELDGHAHR